MKTFKGKLSIDQRRVRKGFEKKNKKYLIFSLKKDSDDIFQFSVKADHLTLGVIQLKIGYL